MNEQLKELARKKEEMLFKESQMNYIFSKQKPSISIGSYVDNSKQERDKKFRVRELLKCKTDIKYREEIIPSLVSK